jgi:ribosome biogenesis ATPase
MRSLLRLLLIVELGFAPAALAARLPSRGARAPSSKASTRTRPSRGRSRAVEDLFPDVAGQREPLLRLYENVVLPVSHPELYERLATDPVRGFLLTGPPGNGKTLMGRALARRLGRSFFLIDAAEVFAPHYGESEAKLRNVFREASDHAPSLIFIDEIDAVGQARSENDGNRPNVVQQLLTLMDGVNQRRDVVVVGATNRPDVLDPALRRPGRFESEIVVKAPDRKGRLEILALHTKGKPLAKGVRLEKLAQRTPGFSGADLAGLVREAGQSALRRAVARLPPDPRMVLDEVRPDPDVSSRVPRYGTLHVKEGGTGYGHTIVVYDGLLRLAYAKLEVREPYRQWADDWIRGIEAGQISYWRDKEIVTGDKMGRLPQFPIVANPEPTPATPAANASERQAAPFPKEVLDRINITSSDFDRALMTIKPSGLRQYGSRGPSVHWRDIAGLEEVKQKLRDAVERPLKHPEAYQRLNAIPKPVLLHGPPGTGKTLLARAVATESGANFISVDTAAILASPRGPAAALAELFRKAKESAPTVLFFDEIDGLAPSRSGPATSERTIHTINQLLVELDGFEGFQGVVVVAATNRPEAIDAALRRPGRFNEIYVGLPNEADRLRAFQIATRTVPLAKRVDLRALAKATEGMTAADIAQIINTAAFGALRKNPRVTRIGRVDLMNALQEQLARRAVVKRVVAPFSPQSSATVRVKINDREEGRFVVDSGADVVTLSRSFADRLGLKLGTPALIHTAGGDAMAQSTQVDVDLDGLRLTNVSAVVSDTLDRVDGLLGMSFLAHFHLTMDPVRSQITISEKSASD